MNEQVTPEMKQARMSEFMKLLPLTLDLAGLPKSPPGGVYTPDQIEGRMMTVRTAYKLARAALREIGDNGV